MTRVIAGLNRWVRRICIFCSGAIFVLAMAQILFRYVFKISAPWTEEAARYTLIWMVLLAAGLAFAKGDHFNIDFLSSRIRPAGQRALTLLTNLLSAVFILGIILWGIPFAKLGFFTLSPGLQITMFIPYLALPVGGLVMLINLIHFSAKIWRRDPEEGPKES
jgi:TRAP-type C4-dicarboxylate transport system permease small subunit